MNYLVNATKTISILGCGWYGMKLAKVLIQIGYAVKGSCTSIKKLELLAKYNIEPFLINFQKDEEKYDPVFFQSDILFVCIPPKRNTAEQMSFYAKVERICNAAKRYKIKHLIFISSTAVYGDLNAEVTELSIPQPETESAKAILEAENLLSNQNAFTCTIIRFAGLVGPNRNPGRFLAGKTDLPNGQAPINLIHLDDCIGISLSIIANEAFGYLFNACSPDHPCKQEFYSKAAIKSQLSPPTFKNELLKWKLVSSVHSPLLNYSYVTNNWMDWISSTNL